MSELAFNINGEPFDLPPTMAAWRVRRLKPKGAPEVVYGRDGLPLFLPLDAEVEDLRREARLEGRYRLDPVDEHHRPIAGAQASYVCVHAMEHAPEPQPPVAPLATVAMDTTAALVGALLESQKQHTELARMYVSQFPVLANAMAGVVRSAGDVGLTARVPLVLPALPEGTATDAYAHDEFSDDDQNDEIEIDEDEVEVSAKPEEYSWARVGQTFVEQIGPYVGPMLATAPGLAKLLGAQGGKPTTDTTAPGPGPSDPAPAGGDAPRTNTPVPRVDAAMMVRLRQVMAQLTPDEEQFARSLIEEISPAEMTSLVDRLRSMSVPEAVMYVRAMFLRARAAAAGTPAAPATSAAAAASPAPTAPRRTGYPASGMASSSSMSARRETPDMRSSRRPAAGAQSSDDGRLRDAGTQLHLDRIERSLSDDERTAMRRHFSALSPSERSLFVATLLMLPIADAVAVVRGQIGAHVSTAVESSSISGDASPAEVPIVPGESAPERMAATPARKRPRPPSPSAATGESAVPTVNTQPNASAALPAAPSSAQSAMPAAVERNAQTHLADIEDALAPDERLVVHTLISELLPDERDAWLDRLLSTSVAGGVAMLRAAIRAATAPAAKANPRASLERATASTAATEEPSGKPDRAHTSHDSDNLDDAHDENDELDADDLTDGDDGEDRDEGGEEVGRSQPAASDEPHTPAASHHRLDAPARTLATDLPTLDADALAHFAAIEDALTLGEKMRANELAAQRPAAELRRWYAELVTLSVDDAVAKIRAELARSDRDSQPTKKGDVS